jgi:hypothetical protein
LRPRNYLNAKKESRSKDTAGDQILQIFADLFGSEKAYVRGREQPTERCAQG